MLEVITIKSKISDSALIICHFNHIERFTEAKGAQVGLCGLVKCSKITCNPWFSTLIPSSTIPLAIFSMLSPSTSLGIIQRTRDHPGRLPHDNLPPFDNLSSPAAWLSIVSPQLLLLSQLPIPAFSHKIDDRLQKTLLWFSPSSGGKCIQMARFANADTSIACWENDIAIELRVSSIS